MSLFFLCVVVLLDVTALTCMKLSQGFTRIVPAFIVALCYGLELLCQSLALRHFQLGTAYAIWGSAGTALSSVVGIVWFRERATVWKMASLGLVVLGVIGLNLGGL